MTKNLPTRAVFDWFDVPEDVAPHFLISSVRLGVNNLLTKPCPATVLRRIGFRAHMLIERGVDLAITAQNISEEPRHFVCELGAHPQRPTMKGRDADPESDQSVGFCVCDDEPGPEVVWCPLHDGSRARIVDQHKLCDACGHEDPDRYVNTYRWHPIDEITIDRDGMVSVEGGGAQLCLFHARMMLARLSPSSRLRVAVTSVLRHPLTHIDVPTDWKRCPGCGAAAQAGKSTCGGAGCETWAGRCAAPDANGPCRGEAGRCIWCGEPTTRDDDLPAPWFGDSPSFGPEREKRKIT